MHSGPMEGKISPVFARTDRADYVKWSLRPTPAGSVTLYDAKKRLMVENPINRYKIGSADKLKAGSDGSTTIYG